MIETLELDPEGIRWWADAIGLLPRSWRGVTTGGRVVASLGAANSVDRFLRERRGWRWTRKEPILEQDLARLGTDAVDVLLGPDAPLSTALARELATRSEEAIALFGHPLWNDRKLAHANAGQVMFHRAVRQPRSPNDRPWPIPLLR